MRNLNKKKGITFLFSSHDKMVMERAQRLIQLTDGVIISDTMKRGKKKSNLKAK